MDANNLFQENLCFGKSNLLFKNSRKQNKHKTKNCMKNDDYDLIFYYYYDIIVNNYQVSFVLSII